MVRKSFIVVLTLICFASISFAQHYEPPANVKYNKPEDYKKYEKDVLRCIEFLETSPLTDSLDRTRANGFLMNWLTGCPYITVSIEAYLLQLVTINKDFLGIFMAGWTKYAIQNPKERDEIKGHLAGLHAIIKYYKENKSAKKDKLVDRIVKADDEGKLREWVDTMIKQYRKKK
jgi:hypothetical protein